MFSECHLTYSSLKVSITVALGEASEDVLISGSKNFHPQIKIKNVNVKLLREKLPMLPLEADKQELLLIFTH